VVHADKITLWVLMHSKMINKLVKAKLITNAYHWALHKGHHWALHKRHHPSVQWQTPSKTVRSFVVNILLYVLPCDFLFGEICDKVFCDRGSIKGLQQHTYTKHFKRNLTKTKFFSFLHVLLLKASVEAFSFVEICRVWITDNRRMVAKLNQLICIILFRHLG